MYSLKQSSVSDVPYDIISVYCFYVHIRSGLQNIYAGSLLFKFELTAGGLASNRRRRRIASLFYFHFLIVGQRRILAFWVVCTIDVFVETIKCIRCSLQNNCNNYTFFDCNAWLLTWKFCFNRFNIFFIGTSQSTLRFCF